MTERWIPLPLDKTIFANLDEDAVVGFNTAIENGFKNELGGFSRFNGLIERVDLGLVTPVYLNDFNGDLIACCDGKVFRIDQSYTVTDVTTTPVAGGRRVIFAKTGVDLLMAAGAEIVRLRSATTEILSPNAPLSSHVAWVQGYTLAVEIDSQRFFHSGAGTPDQWDPLDTFAADVVPDNVTSLLVTPFGDVMLGGEGSIEQFERVDGGDAPFARRWAVASGVKLPYVLSFADNAMWWVNSANELVFAPGQIYTRASDDIGLLLEKIDDWRDAWIGGPLNIQGQKFILIQAPFATNEYGTKGVTLLYDRRQKGFSSLYGWDSDLSAPTRWPGWSHWRLWDKTFVGGNGKIYELTDATHLNGADLQRWLVRTAHMASGSGAIINNFRLQVVRGRGSNTAASTIRVRCSRDGKPFGSWIRLTLGKAGERSQMLEFGSFGSAQTFRFEIACTDDCAVDLKAAEIKSIPLGH